MKRNGTSEYFSNGNGNGNGHGREEQKVFELARPKTEAELAREAVRKTMPKICRSISMRKMCAQAKWLFHQISDDSFMNDFGGDGFGTLCTSIKDIAARYGHDRDSISKWLNILVDEEVIWWTGHWPLMQIRISAVVPPPAHQASLVQKIRARYLVASRETHAEDARTGLFLSQNGKSPHETEDLGTPNGHVPPNCAEDTGTSCPQLPHTMRKIPARNGGQLPQGVPTTPAQCAEDTRTVCPQLPHGVPAPSASQVEQPPANTGENRALEVLPNNRKGKSQSPEGRNGGAIAPKVGGGKIEARCASRKREGGGKGSLRSQAGREAQISSASAPKSVSPGRGQAQPESKSNGAAASDSATLRCASPIVTAADQGFLAIAKDKLEKCPDMLTDKNVERLVKAGVTLPKEVSQRFRHLVVPDLRAKIAKRA